MLHDDTGNILRKHLIYRKGIAQEEINNDKNVGKSLIPILYAILIYKSDSDIMQETNLLSRLYFAV